MQERMDSFLLQAISALTSVATPPVGASAASLKEEQRSPLLTSAASAAIVPALLRRRSLSLRKSASETFKER